MTIELIGVAFSHGLISALSACVYPLIPITTTIFGAGKVGHWAEGLFLSMVYVIGMALTYVAIGLLAAFGGTVFGSYLGDPVVVGTFAGIFILLGLGFLGVIPLPIPNFADKINIKKTNSIVYPLLLGIFSGFIAAPCTAPLFGALLIEIAKNSAENNSILPGVVQSLAFSFGMGVPFLLIGTFALKLPKPGKWLQAVKYIGATVLFTASYHYLEDLYGPFPPAGEVWMYAALGIALFAVFLMLSEPLSAPEQMNFRKKVYTTTFLLIAGFGLFMATSPFAIKSSKTSIVNHSSQKWHSTLSDGLVAAKQNNSVVLMDFWAEWCVSCFEMEEKLFGSSDFQSLVEKYNINLVRLDYTTTDTDEEIEIAEKYKIKGLPTLVILDKNGNLIDTLLGFRNKEESMGKLKNILSSVEKEK